MKTLDEIRQGTESGTMSAEQAIAFLTEIIASDAAPDCREQALSARGLLYWKMERRADAINDYNAAISINADSAAVRLKESAYAILDFYNKDLYNP